MSMAIVDKESCELVPAAQMQDIMAIDSTAKSFQRAIIDAEESANPMAKGLLIAKATRTLRALLTDELMEDIMELMNTPLGFKTDRPNQRETTPYKIEIVRDVVIQALIRGFQVTGNQINIIGGNLYVTKEGFEHRLQNFEGLSNLEVDFEVPDTSNPKTAFVGCVARWKLYGKPGELSCRKAANGDFRIPIRVNEGQSMDAILGKAKSKLYRRVFERLLGIATSSVDPDGTVDAESVTDATDATPITIPMVSAETKQPYEAPQIEREQLPIELEKELEQGLSAVVTLNQFDACKQYWRNKAKNRQLSQGQLETMRGMFEVREKLGFMNA